MMATRVREHITQVFVGPEARAKGAQGQASAIVECSCGWHRLAVHGQAAESAGDEHKEKHAGN